MGGTVQKWLFWLVALGATGMVLAKPDAFYKVTDGIKNVTAGSVSQVAKAA